MASAAGTSSGNDEGDQDSQQMSDEGSGWVDSEEEEQNNEERQGGQASTSGATREAWRVVDPQSMRSLQVIRAALARPGPRRGCLDGRIGAKLRGSRTRQRNGRDHSGAGLGSAWLHGASSSSCPGHVPWPPGRGGLALHARRERARPAGQGRPDQGGRPQQVPEAARGASAQLTPL
jgi:hypothetical protein